LWKNLRNRAAVIGVYRSAFGRLQAEFETICDCASDALGFARTDG
jgi:hypothetical protein